jgi:uncharacterized RDD family membrane protein YckC
VDEHINQDTAQNFTDGTASATSGSQAVSGVVYASFFDRFVAALIDAVLVGFGTGIFSAVFGAMGDFVRALGGVISAALSIAYYVYFISQKGQTLGKKVMGIRVQSESTGQNLDVVSTILREVVGKFLSGAVLLLGYFWMLWDSKKQTWHDKIAKSVVVKVN